MSTPTALPSNSVSSLPPGFAGDVLSPLSAAGRTLKRFVIVEGACRCAAVLLATAAVQMFLDKLLVLGLGPRAALLIGVVGIVAWQAWTYVVRPALIPISPLDMAAILEHRNPELRDELVSAVAFATQTIPPDQSPGLIHQVLARSQKRMSQLQIAKLYRRDRHHRFLAAGFSAVAIAALATWARPDLVATYIARDLLLQDIPWPSGITLILDGFKQDRLRWPVGDDLTLVVTAPNIVPQGLRAEFSFDTEAVNSTGLSDAAAREMARRGERQFVLDYGPLQRSMKVRFSIWKLGVDERTRWYTIDAVERPSVKDMTIEISPPPYAALDAFKLPAGQTSADVLAGSRVRISAGLNKPVVRAHLNTSEGPVMPAALESAQRATAEITPSKSGAYFFDLLDQDGLTDQRPVTCTIRLMHDSPPNVRFLLPGVGDMITSGAILPLTIECEDNLGLSRIELIRRIQYTATNGDSGKKTTTTQPTEDAEALPGLEQNQKRYSLKSPWPVSALSLSTGSVLALQVRARDNQPTPTVVPTQPTSDAATSEADGGPSVSRTVGNSLGESVVHTLRIVTPEELMAELARRENEWRREFEQIIKVQEQINSHCVDLAGQAADQPSKISELALRYAQEERTQRAQATRVRAVARQFEQILAEMEVNQLATSAIRRRLQNGIVGPLFALASADIPAAAEVLERLNRGFDAKQADLLAETHARIMRSMNAIVALMLKWEGYEEAVSLLRDIIKLQGDINQETQKRLQEQMNDLFGEDPSTQPASP